MAEIANIDLEDGTLDAFDSTITDGGQLSVELGAALAGTTFGMQLVIDDTTELQGRANIDISSAVEIRYRFHFDINGLTMADDDEFTIFEVRRSVGPNTVGKTAITRVSGAYFIKQRIRQDGSEVANPNFAITDAPHSIEVSIEKASTDSASDGRTRILIDGVLEHTESDIDLFDNWDNVNHVRVGAAGLESGTSGTFFLDQILIRDDNQLIGPHVSMVGPGMMMGVGT